MHFTPYTPRILQAFQRYIDVHHPADGGGPRLEGLGASVDLASTSDAVEGWVERSGDPALGLKVGQAANLGSASALDYAMRSAASLRDAVALAHRYRSLYSEACEPALVVEDERALIRLDGERAWPRTFAEFTMSLWFHVHLRPVLAAADDLECLFAHAEPADLTAYRSVFGEVRLTFDSAHYGFRSRALLVDRRLDSADAALHSLHCEHLERLLERLPRRQSVAARVRAMLAGELRRGHLTSSAVAKNLRMSRRTLGRRLASEGTTFSEQLDVVRQQLAMRFIATPALTLQDISALLGFSQVQGFHRAFKRWTGRTPVQHRASVSRGGVCSAA